MKNIHSLRSVLMGLLLAAASGFAQIPDSIWRANDTGFFDLWNKRNLDTTFFWEHATNWSVKNSGTDSAIIATDGQAFTGGAWTNLVWKWRATPAQKNFEIRFSWHMLGTPSGNSGFNARGRCQNGTVATLCGGSASGYRVNGPQIDLGPTYTTDIWNSATSGNRYATGSATCKIPANDPNRNKWQDLAYKIVEDTAIMLYYVNGFAAGSPTQCAKFKYTAATDVAATSQGMFALQYETRVVSEFKNLKIRNLDAVQGPSALRNPGKSGTLFAAAGARGAIAFTIPEAGRYSIRISDLHGRTVRSLELAGPVAHQSVSLGDRSGIFFVKIVSDRQTTLKKVYVH